jgi:fibronectin-binding autotransporter adhesin
LALGGKGKATFDVSNIGTQYQGFGIFVKTGSSTWTLTGTTSAVTPWALDAGTLDIATLGAAGTSSITFGNGPATLHR